MDNAPRLAVVVALGLISALIWIRVGLYGFGLPVGLVALVPVGLLIVLYLRMGRTRDVGIFLGAFAGSWTAFETWTWVNAATDPSVSIPGWTPFPLVAAVVLLVVGVGVALLGSSEPQ